MRFTKFNNQTHIPLFTTLLFLSLSFYLACTGGGTPKPADETAVLTSAAPAIIVQPGVPSDITGGAPNATLMQAALFAWQEFIALNWPALPGFRDSANVNAMFGGPNDTVLVWHTFRHKVEIYPGNGKPPHGAEQGPPDYGYNQYPAYYYTPDSVGKGGDGQVKPCGAPSSSTPWVNLDEINEIGVATMFAGAGSTTYPGQQILFLAKANKSEYVYVTKNGWNAGGTKFNNAQTKTVAYIKKNSNTPPPTMGDSLVSFPYGTIEVKTGWRRLTSAEQQSGHFYTTKVRYYQLSSTTKKPCYTDEVLGMVALHIIHKTPTAPYFTFATFEQTDNILTTGGKPVEDSLGNLIANLDSMPLNPNFKVKNATPSTPIMFSPTIATSKPGSSLYYYNTPSQGLPTGSVTINRRMYPIPPDIIAANKSAHDAITTYNKKNGIKKSPWTYYRLTNVQYKPINKPTPGVNYSAADSANYYLSNSVVESDHILQQFSGKFSGLKGAGGNTITDFTNTIPPKSSAQDTTAYNAYHNGKFLMGGCMGCHGNATNGGSDYSFILGFPVQIPAFAAPAGQPIDLNSSKFKQLRAFLKLNK
ncbi:MAG: hypothetical protein H7246_20390 [Phycisphaerae bacterium]|nr:hypothetical protein [Saprospiraceae bacterium]